MYLFVRNQVRVTPMGDVIDLDYGAVLDTIKLYVAADEVKEAFDFVVKCFSLEKELE